MVGLAACATEPQNTAPSPANPIPYTLDEGGIQLVGQSLRIDFGRTDHSTERAMNKLVGGTPVSRAVCADGRPFVAWVDGTRLYFSGGAFRGWEQSAPDGTVRQAGTICA